MLRVLDWIKYYFLKRSIKRHGIKQPIILSRDHSGHYDIPDGNTRLTIARELKIKVPAVIIDSNIIMMDPNDIK